MSHEIDAENLVLAFKTKKKQQAYIQWASAHRKTRLAQVFFERACRDKGSPSFQDAETAALEFAEAEVDLSQIRMSGAIWTT